MTNPSETAAVGGLDVFSTGLVILLALVAARVVWRRPLWVAAVLVGVVAWWETSTRPLWPWLAALAWLAFRAVRRFLLWLRPGAIR